MPPTLIYCYCVIKASRRPVVRRAPSGVPGAGAAEAIEFARGYWLVATEVPAGTYAPEPLREALGDMTWVSAAALAHNAVIEFFARAGSATTIPLKVFTLFSTRERASANMRTERRTIATIARRVQGCEEWGIRVLRGGPRSASPADRSGARTGAAFLAAKKQARDQARAEVILAAGSAERAFRVLRSVARAAVRRAEVPAGASSPPLLDAAFLVPGGRRAQFRAAAKRAAADCAAAGAELTLTGPWPAYSFVQGAGSRR